MRFEALGPLRACADGAEVPLGPPRQQAVLVVLLHQEGRSLAYDALVDAVWGDRPPAHVRNLVQKYVSGIRRALAGSAAAVTWTGGGYRLTGAALDDLRERHALLVAATAARNGGDLARAVELAEQAESLWRGEFAEGLAGPYLEAERRRWAEKRLLVRESRLEVQLELGRYHECVHELTRQVAAHPLRERLVWLQMLALYRSGRAADALVAYAQARTRIAAEIGADPGPALRSLHERVLRQDPGLLLDAVPAA